MYFIYSPYENSSSDFSSHSLVLPALTVGNVGQLTIDVLICTFKCPRVGFIDDPFVLPAVGNDPFTPVRNGILTTKLEVFQLKEKNVVFLQQRAPVMRGYASQFAANLISWTKRSNFKEIVLLFSADATRRSDKHLREEYISI
jgi:proteasome assembly chaperone 2